MEHVGLYLYVDVNAVANGVTLHLHVRRDFCNIIFKIKQVTRVVPKVMSNNFL